MYTDKEYIAKQFAELKAKYNYSYDYDSGEYTLLPKESKQGERITNELFSDIAECQPSAVSYWCTGRKLMSEKYRERITKTFGLDVHYFDLEYSEEYIQSKQREEELRSILSSKEEFVHASKVNMNNLIYSWYQATYNYLLTTDFGETVEKLKEQGKVPEVAELLQIWVEAFRGLYYRLKDLVNSFADRVYSIETKYDKEIGNPQMEQELRELAKQYDFTINGSFDLLENMELRLFTDDRNPPPIEEKEK